MAETYLTISEAAELLGKTGPTVFYWVQSGKLPNARMVSDKLGRRWEIPRSDLEAVHVQAKKESPAACYHRGEQWRRLAAAVIVQAVKDLRGELATDAAAFLQSPAAAGYLVLLDCDPDWVSRLDLRNAGSK